MLLILTSNRDFAADYLIVHLIERDLPYFRLNSEEISTAGYSFILDRTSTSLQIIDGSRELDLDAVTAVWYRRALQPSLARDVPPDTRPFVAGELRHLVTGMVLGAEVLWVNPIHQVYRAEHKVLQLQIAQRLGFTVPRTIVSWDRRVLQRFASEARTPIICKPIYTGLQVESSRRYSVYTHRVTAADLDDEESLRLCPILLQEEIFKKADVRATFIGRECFVVEIQSAGAALLDWRTPDAHLRYSVASLPAKVEAKCRLMLTKLDLHYGAFDFVRTPDDDYVFLEINPTGEWAWLEDRLGLPMREAFVRLFYGGSQ
jgi:hypothetical protein